MKLELRRATDGTGLVICVCSDVAQRQIVIPLSHDLSSQIGVMLEMEGIGPEKLLLPPRLARN